MRPQARGPERVAREDGGGRPHARVGVENAIGELLEEMRLLRVDPEVMELHLGLGPRQGGDPLEGSGIAVLVGHEKGGRPRRGEQRGEDDACARARGETEAPAQAEDGIQDGPGGVGERPSLDHGHRRADAAPPSQESRAVGLVLRAAHAYPFHRHHVRGPEPLLVVDARRARGEEGIELRHRLRLHEEVREGRVRVVAAGRGEHQLGVGGDVDLARLAPQVDERHAADLGIVLRRDQHLERAHDGAVAPANLDPVLEEGRLVGVGLHPRGLMAGRPHRAAASVAQEDEGAPGVAGHVFSPARDGNAPAAAVAGAGRRHHHHIATVGQEMGPGERLGGGGEAARGGNRRLAQVAGRPHFLAPRPRHRHVARRALVQEQLGRLHHGRPVEALAQAPVEEHVGERGHRHALVMRHVGAHHRDARPLGPPRPGEVQRLVEPVRALPTEPPELDEVSRRRGGVDHGRQRGRVRRDHEVLAQPALQPQPGDTEARVLIGQVEVADVVRGLRDSPRDAVGRAVRDLALDDEPARLLEQAALGRPHDQRGHEVLEHRSRPRHQRGAQLERRHRAAKTEPVRGGHLAARDGEEARQTGLGREQVVATLVEDAVGDAEPDGEELAGAVEEEGEVHALREGDRGSGQRLRAPRRRLARERRALEVLRRLRHAAPVQARRSRPVAAGVDEAVKLAGRRLGEGRRLVERGQRPQQARRRGQIRGGVRGQRRDHFVERLRPGREGVEVAPVTGDGRLEGVEPCDDLGAAVLVELARGLAQRGGPGGEVTQPRRPGGRRVGLRN